MRAAHLQPRPPYRRPTSFLPLALKCQLPWSCSCLTQRGAFSSREPGAPGDCGAINISGWVESQEQGAVGTLNDCDCCWKFRKWISVWGEAGCCLFIARAHPPVLFMKCIASNQNVFEFHPCLVQEARSRGRVCKKCSFQGGSKVSRAEG